MIMPQSAGMPRYGAAVGGQERRRDGSRGLGSCSHVPSMYLRYTFHVSASRHVASPRVDLNIWVVIAVTAENLASGARQPVRAGALPADGLDLKIDRHLVADRRFFRSE